VVVVAYLLTSYQLTDPLGKKLVDEILELSEDMNIDLIVMASSKVTSS
jgi:hypothetical protein